MERAEGASTKTLFPVFQLVPNVALRSIQAKDALEQVTQTKKKGNRIDRRIIKRAILAVLFAIIFVTQAVTSVRAETGTPLTPGLPKWFLDANGTVFQITNSGYMNVTLTSAIYVHAFLEVGPRVVSYGIECPSSAASTVLTLSGFLPSNTYYRYQDGNLTESFITDSSGSYSYVQDLSSPHHIFIVENITTIYIRSDGSIEPSTAPIHRDGNVYTFKADIYETIVIERDNIIIDGNGYTLQDADLWKSYGFYVYKRSNVTIRNTRIKSFWLGIYFWKTVNSRIENATAIDNTSRGIVLYQSSGNVVSGNNALNNDWGGIFLYNSFGDTVSGNDASNNMFWGIWIYYSVGNTVSGNNAINNGVGGIGIQFSHSNTVSDNNFANNGYGIGIWWAGGNTICHNNFIDNVYQAYITLSGEEPPNAWDDGYPSGGNYWSDYGGTDFYSGPYQNVTGGDGIGDMSYIKWGIEDHYPFIHENGWEKYYLTVETEPSGVATIPGEGWYDEGTSIELEAPAIISISPCIQYRFDHWTVDGNVVSENPIAVQIDGPHIAKAFFVEQYYLTVTSPYDTSGGEGWYDVGETAYATLAIGLEYVDGLAYGFVCWSGDGSGWDLISDPILMDAPKTLIANWESSQVYGDIRTVGFWKHQVNVWYFTELANTGMKIRGIGTAQVSQEELMAYLKFISENSGYAKLQGIWVEGSELATLKNAYDLLKTPRGPDCMKMRAEQQLLVLWLNLADKAFWNTQLSQDTVYIYCQYTFDEVNGLATIGEAILFCEAELPKPDSNYEAVKDICDSINNNLGIIWGT